MTQHLARVGRYAFLVVVTVLATAVMWWVSRKSDQNGFAAEASAAESLPVASRPRAVVAAQTLRPAVRDVTIRYSGKVAAWEDYFLGFEVGGRVESLGQGAEGAPLDDGDRVEAGQLLARLDDRVLRAQVAEATANFELASSELERNRRARNVITDSEYQAAVATRAQTAALLRVAEKRLEDSLLRSPIAGVIARRMVEAGESVNANQTVFEIVENDRLRLVLNVPEARVRELELRRRRVAEVVTSDAAATDPEARVFRARVRLEGTNLFGKPWPPIDAEVYRIAEVADATTGLFEVEIAIDNREGLLRPGMVATAGLVIDRVYAYELPESAILFRPGETFAFVVEQESAAMPVLVWETGETTLSRARRIDLESWIDQGETVLVPAEGLDLGAVVTRGQQRLRDGQLIRLIDSPGTQTTVSQSPAEPRSAASGRKSG